MIKTHLNTSILPSSAKSKDKQLKCLKQDNEQSSTFVFKGLGLTFKVGSYTPYTRPNKLSKLGEEERFPLMLGNL